MIQNLFEEAPSDIGNEEASNLVVTPNLRIERIVSTGQASPPGFWFDQAWSEWVTVLSGSAGLFIEGETKTRTLRAGDHLLIPAHMRHRVEWTSNPTIWLAVHFP